MSEVLTRVDEGEKQIAPPHTRFVRFCVACGRNDRFTLLRERHFSGGGLCGGLIVTLEYTLVNSEHERLRAAVVDAAIARRKAKLAEVGGAGDYIMTLHATMLAEHTAVDALIAFEAEHKIGD
jgi:hypothetical protein